MGGKKEIPARKGLAARVYVCKRATRFIASRSIMGLIITNSLI